MLGSGGFEASSLTGGLLGIRIGPIVIIEQWHHSGLGLSELFGWVKEILLGLKTQGNACVAHPSLMAAYCVCLQHLDCQGNCPVSLCVLG